ncbi:MAG: hypothetical protein KTR31_00815 [Myxococcales bacterium]|nr:hypothetical protein [Myxococcales bacterium]
MTFPRFAIATALVGCTGYQFDPDSIEDADTDTDVVGGTTLTNDSGEPVERERPWDCYGRTEVDDDGDGDVDDVEYHIYDLAAQDLQLRYERDFRDDGRLEAFTDYAYDARGNRTLMAEDYDGDGVVNRRQIWAYDDGDRELSYTRDDDDDGTPEYVRVRTYTKEGHPLTRDEDADGDGVFEEQRAYTTDDDGLIVAYVDDIDDDGKPDHAYAVTYDEQGREILIEGRDIAKKTLIYRLSSTYTPVKGTKGHERWEASVDITGDGNANQRFDYIYDAEGNIIEAHQDTLGVGVFDRNWYELTYDDELRTTAFRYVFVDATDLDESEFDVVWEFERASGPWEKRYAYTLENRTAAGDVLGTGAYEEITVWTCPAR